MVEFRCDHIHLRSPDPERTARFYVDVLGARDAGSVQARGALRRMVELGGLNIFIEAVPDTTPSPPPAPFMGLEHVGFAVSDLDAAQAKLAAHGVSLLGAGIEQVRPGVRIAFIEGPERVRIEMIERKPTL
ncbi:VOC family protein [Sabulicella rubraurantiaca]|uniref:VOC family protein n=1 Tax=Sabulicella rubraurantiaca TaxID=2811429 RepID=UPI001A95F49B|nr:VOC family protein [Sabulicella rubraurantiaca]